MVGAHGKKEKKIMIKTSLKKRTLDFQTWGGKYSMEQIESAFTKTIQKKKQKQTTKKKKKKPLKNKKKRGGGGGGASLSRKQGAP